jgi:hypothetical protein
MRSGSQLEPIAWSIGYEVVFVSVVALPLASSCERETPCSASFHQPYCWTPSRGIAGAALELPCEAFSASVIRDTRSAARSWKE